MNRFNLIFNITFTHLITRIKQSGIAALGVTFGIGTFIIMVSFMTGLNGLLDGLILNRTPHVHIYNELKPTENQPIYAKATNEDFYVVRSIKPKQNQTKIRNANALIQLLEQNEQVRGVSPQVQAKAFYLAGSLQLGGVINGIDVEEEVRLFKFEDYVVEGKAADLLKTNNSILLGAGVADKLSLKLGDRVQVANTEGNIIDLKIVGIFQSGLADVDMVQSFVSLSVAQQILKQDRGYITDINVKLWDIENAVAMGQFLENNFNVTAVDINAANAQFDTGTSIRNLITYAVSITLLIVAGFGIYNILNMFIYEKMNDIAILKATGFTGKDVQLIFISQALIIGFLGGLLGLGVGYLVSLAISNAPFETEALPTIDTYPVNFNPVYYLIGFSFAMVSTFLAGYLPSRKAKKIDPVEIIRGQ